MNLSVLGSNQTELRINGNVVFFSYNTPVAALFEGKYYRTSKKWSNTTSKHINKWLDGIEAELKEQSFFDELVK